MYFVDATFFYNSCTTTSLNKKKPNRYKTISTILVIINTHIVILFILFQRTRIIQNTRSWCIIDYIVLKTIMYHCAAPYIIMRTTCAITIILTIFIYMHILSWSYYVTITYCINSVVHDCILYRIYINALFLFFR